MRAPSNIVTTSKYTLGKEFVLADSYKDYQGYYYEISGKYFAGKEFNVLAPELLKLDSDKIDKLRLNAATSIFGLLTKVAIQGVGKVSSIQPTGDTLRYFVKQINVNPIVIKEVDKNTFNQLKLNPLYQTLEVDIPSNTEVGMPAIDEADKKMPGLKAFLLG